MIPVDFHFAYSTLQGFGLFINLLAALCTDSGCTTTFSANHIPYVSQLLPSLTHAENVSWLAEHKFQLALHHPPPLPVVLQSDSFSVSGVVSPGKDVGVTVELGGLRQLGMSSALQPGRTNSCGCGDCTGYERGV